MSSCLLSSTLVGTSAASLHKVGYLQLRSELLAGDVFSFVARVVAAYYPGYSPLPTWSVPFLLVICIFTSSSLSWSLWCYEVPVGLSLELLVGSSFYNSLRFPLSGELLFSSLLAMSCAFLSYTEVVSLLLLELERDSCIELF